MRNIRDIDGAVDAMDDLCRALTAFIEKIDPRIDLAGLYTVDLLSIADRLLVEGIDD